MWIRNLSTTVFFFDSSHKFFHSLNHATHLTEAYVLRALSNISDEAFCETIFAVNYFCKMLHLRCLTGFWICLCLRLASLKLYLFSRNIKSRLSYQFWKLFTVVIRTKSYDKIMAMSIILGNHNNINIKRERFYYVFILKIILRNLDVFHDIWGKFQDFKKGLAFQRIHCQPMIHHLDSDLHLLKSVQQKIYREREGN